MAAIAKADCTDKTQLTKWFCWQQTKIHCNKKLSTL